VTECSADFSGYNELFDLARRSVNPRSVKSHTRVGQQDRFVTINR
jgi:hypothetical protein